MTKKFYVVSYEENGVTKYYTDKKNQICLLMKLPTFLKLNDM